jgi:acetylornithine deacetylase
MKGGCAAMIEAITGLVESEEWTQPVALCLVVGEEENGDGAEALMQEHHFPWAIIGEPTDLTPCLKSYGYLECQIVAQGKRRHASLANPAHNAIEALLAATLGLSHHIAARHPQLVYNIRDLFSSQAGFAVPEWCEGWFDIHVPPELSIGEILTDIEEAVLSKKNASSGVELTFRATTIDAGYMLPHRGKVVETLKTLFQGHGLEWKPDAFRSHSDANRIWAAGTRPVLLGPGRLEHAHTEEESVSFKQVCRAAELYLDLMRRVV